MARGSRGVLVFAALLALADGDVLSDRSAAAACPGFGPLPSRFALQHDALSALYSIAVTGSGERLGTLSRTLFSWGAELRLHNAQGELVGSVHQGVLSGDVEFYERGGRRVATGQQRALRLLNSSEEAPGFRLLNATGETMGETLDLPGWATDPLGPAVVTLMDGDGQVLAYLEKEPGAIPLAWRVETVAHEVPFDQCVLTLFTAMQFPGIMWISLGPALVAVLCALGLCSCLCFCLWCLVGSADKVSGASMPWPAYVAPHERFLEEEQAASAEQVEEVERGCCTMQLNECCGSVRTHPGLHPDYVRAVMMSTSRSKAPTETPRRWKVWV